VAEQYTDYGRLQQNGEAVPNPDGQELRSSITQLVFGYTITPRFSVQANVPIIDRNFRRAVPAGIETGSVSGFGDVSLIANAQAYSLVSESSLLRLTAFFGLEFPSGNSNLLGEELPTKTDPCAGIPPVFCQTRQFHLRHDTGPGGVPTAVHGHDLALGSGSTDVIFGGQAFGTWERLYGIASAQYALRTTGSFGYRYADDLIVSGTAGAFVLLAHNYSLGLEAVLSCDTKGNDTIDDVPVTDTALTVLYAGPGVRVTAGTSLTAEVIGDLPAIENNSGLQVVPSYRIRGGLVWRF
jgi:hypothetical protein